MNWLIKRLDRYTEARTRNVAQTTARRSFVGRLAMTLTGVSAIPLLPVARAQDGKPAEQGDPNSCDYWRYCAIDGFLCGCCGGSMNTCPPGTEMSPITWIGTCENPADGKSYIISYNDCCGKTSCGACLCNRNEADRPIYRPQQANDINWCIGTKHLTYNCSTAVVIGTALDQ